MLSAQDWIEKLRLEPLPYEGGYFRQTLKNEFSTAIYYLITPTNFSALHRLTSDEVFHFCAGDPVDMIQITEAGKLSRIALGPDVQNGQALQTIVPRHVWQGCHVRPDGTWSLFGATCAPGFSFDIFELGDREKLSAAWPQHRDDIVRYTRPPQEVPR